MDRKKFAKITFLYEHREQLFFIVFGPRGKKECSANRRVKILFGTFLWDFENRMFRKIFGNVIFYTKCVDGRSRDKNVIKRPETSRKFFPNIQRKFLKFPRIFSEICSIYIVFLVKKYYLQFLRKIFAKSFFIDK